MSEEFTILPSLKQIPHSRNILLETFDSFNNNFDCKNRYILEFHPHFNVNSPKEKTLLLTTSKNIIISTTIRFGEFDFFDLQILENIGENNGEDFIDWILSFYQPEMKNYNNNIYNNIEKNITIYRLDDNLNKVSKINFSNCTIASPKFYNYKNKIKISLKIYYKHKSLWEISEKNQLIKI